MAKKKKKQPAAPQRITLTDMQLPALYAAIAEMPKDDTLRLAIADRYDEEDRPVRANFIRKQVELFRQGKTANPEELRQLEETLHAHRAEWVRDDLEAAFARWRALGVEIPETLANQVIERPDLIVFERGFASFVSMLQPEKIRENPLWMQGGLIAYAKDIESGDDDVLGILRDYMDGNAMESQLGKPVEDNQSSLSVGAAWTQAVCRMMLQSDRLNHTNFTTAPVSVEDVDNVRTHTLLTAFCGPEVDEDCADVCIPILLAGGVDPNQRGPHDDAEDQQFEDIASYHPLLSAACYASESAAEGDELRSLHQSRIRRAMQLLIDHGANPNHSINGYNLLDYAVRANEGRGIVQEGIKMLRDFGAVESVVSLQELGVQDYTYSQLMLFCSTLRERCIEGEITSLEQYRGLLLPELARYCQQAPVNLMEGRSEYAYDAFDDIITWLSQPKQSAFRDRTWNDDSSAAWLLPLRDVLDFQGGWINEPHDKPSGHFANSLDEYLTLADEAAHPAVVRMMLEMGINPNARNENGDTALDISMDDDVSAVIREFGGKTRQQLEEEEKPAPKVKPKSVKKKAKNPDTPPHG